jgi:hypothetical protein
MKVPEGLLKAVGFITWQNQNTNELKPAGTFFLLAHDAQDNEPGSRRAYVVTARHVIDGLTKQGSSKTYLRTNKTTGGMVAIATNTVDWFFHPTRSDLDVAIHYMTGLPDLELLSIPFNLCVSEKIWTEQEIGLGDEVFIGGLFSKHFDTSRNIPIVRVGNIAALKGEKVRTRNFGLMDAYLIECRSIAGLSGSPVFVNLGTHRVLRGQQQFSDSPFYFLLGVIHGHYDETDKKIDSVEATFEDGITQPEKLNVGIAIVTPIDGVLEVVREYEKLHPVDTDEPMQ